MWQTFSVDVIKKVAVGESSDGVSVGANTSGSKIFVRATQGEVGTCFRVILLCNGEPYYLSDGVEFSVWYEGTSGKGNYTQINGRTPVIVSGNVLQIEMIPQMIAVAGAGTLGIMIHESNGAIRKLFDIVYIVDEFPGYGSEEATVYFTAFSEALDGVRESVAKAAEAAASFETDKSLSVEGKAADAAAVSRVITPYNLLDNSDFRNPVNQRGKTQYTSGYTIDRWFQGVSFVVDVTNEGVAISEPIQEYGSAFRQKVLWNRTDVPVTFAVCDSDGNITVVSGIPRSEWTLTSVEWGSVGFQYTNNMIIVNIRVDYGYNRTFRWAALYEGAYTADTLPKYRPKGYGVELAECQRYFKVYHNPCVPCGNSSAGTKISGYIPGGMRVNPTISLTNMYLFISAGSYLAIDSATAMSEDSGIIVTFNLASTVSANTSGIAAGGSITLSADF